MHIIAMDPIHAQFVCNAPETTAILAKHENPAFVKHALDEFARFKIKESGFVGFPKHLIKDRISGLHMKFDPRNPSNCVQVARVHITRTMSDISDKRMFEMENSICRKLKK